METQARKLYSGSSEQGLFSLKEQFDNDDGDGDGDGEEDDCGDSGGGNTDNEIDLFSKIFFCILKLPSHSVFFGRNITSLRPILPERSSGHNNTFASSYLTKHTHLQAWEELAPGLMITYVIMPII